MSLLTRQPADTNTYLDTKVPDGPPRLPPAPIGMASSPPRIVAKAMPKYLPKAPNSIPYTIPDVHRPDLFPIAVHTHQLSGDEECIREIRSHYLDDRYTQWKEFVAFSKVM